MWEGDEPPLQHSLYSIINHNHSSLTFTGELVSRAGDLHLDPAPPLGVLAAAEVWHRLLAFLVHVHITGWGVRKEGARCIIRGRL